MQLASQNQEGHAIGSKPKWKKENAWIVFWTHKIIGTDLIVVRVRSGI